MTKAKGGPRKAPDPKSQKETLRHAGRLRGATEIVQCPTCRGSGKRGDRKCGLCDGNGSIEAHK